MKPNSFLKIKMYITKILKFLNINQLTTILQKLNKIKNNK